MRRLTLLLGSLSCAVLFTACPPKKVYPACDSDEACKTEGRAEVCVQGRCVECATDEQCKEGFSCQDNRCVPPTECAPDRPCPEGEQCTAAGKCVQCTEDAQCGEGQICRDNACVPRPQDYCTQDADCGSGQSCEQNRCVVSEAAAGCTYEPIRFGFNESSLASLESGMREKLDTTAQCLKKNPRPVTLEGHADERGTEEYNLQLSEKRAATVRRYLGELGVSSDMRTVGYGETRPVESGATEEAYEANRRVEFNFGR